MDTAMIKQQALKFKNARTNLLMVVVFTTVNLILAAFNAGIYMLFSATIPQLIFETGRIVAEELEINGILIIGLVIAILIISLYFICWLLTKRSRVFILVALIFFSIDSLLFLFLTLAAEFEISFLLDIAFHGWVMFYLINGTIAWAKLRGVSADEYHAVLKETDVAAVNQNIDDVLQQDEEENQKNVPLRFDDKKGRILIQADYEDLQISMKRTRGLTELIVNGNVYDEVKGTIETEYTLTANVLNKKITGVYHSVKSHMYLYVNDLLIAKKLRLF